jgi:uncharacterized membrane protein YkvA (DUF1232 family)
MAMSAQTITQDAGQWSETGFWRKLAHHALAAGYQVVEEALWLYYASQRPDCPVWARATVYGALGYFISMVDAVPDVTPVLGYADDMGVIALALTTLAAYIDDDVKLRAAATLEQYFPTGS